MCRLFTWIWDSCGVAWCRGAPCGRARHRTVWTTSVGHIMCLRISSRPVSTISFRPWTVRRQIWADALKPCHSGVSTDVLLFSEINLSLVHHYRVFWRRLPHYAFRRDYLSRLRVFVSQASAMAQGGLVSIKT